jgi:hypothetical protein
MSFVRPGPTTAITRPTVHPNEQASSNIYPFSVMNNPGIHFHLIHEPLGIQSAGGPPQVMELPAGVARLGLTPEGAPVLLAPSEQRPLLLLEPVRHDDHWRLLLVNPDGAAVRINASPAPPTSLLQNADQIRLRSGLLLEVAVYHRPYTGPAATAHIGRRCPVCKVPITAQSSVYCCVCCGATMHHRAEVGGEVVECALAVGLCPSCRGPIQLQEGYLTPPRLVMEEQ